ncbi:MAG: nickel pincer cofactor biosynthesis protein LarB [Deltaproteobacteria bacterium]|nr:nickel pincer cofactor biosynthesis protein LarB [Deltaproteobacteria bacterium]
MQPKWIKDILVKVKDGQLNIDEAMAELKHLPCEDISVAMVDHHREIRQGFPEVIFGQGKTVDQISLILENMLPRTSRILITRIPKNKALRLQDRFVDLVYWPDSRILTYTDGDVAPAGRGMILVLSAGTSDIPVAEEVVVTARMMGHQVESVYDVGVAGIHRLFLQQEKINRANVFVAVAGMEGALPSVVAGLVDKPVIAVPTSVGYGGSFGGVAALLAMLNSCASGVAVVNIDNGFGAGYLAALINS